MARVFVAVWPPADVVDALRGLPRTMPGVRWTGEEQWHVTLRFLGSVPDDVVPSVSAVLDPWVGACPEREVTLGPSLRRFGRALAFSVEGLADVAAAVASATAGFGQPPEARRFTGHLTLARARQRRPSLTAAPALEATWTVDEIALVQSFLGGGPGGRARYENVSVHQLA